MTRLGAAVVGTGFIGPVHVEALQRAGLHVTGVLGSSPEKSRRSAEALGLAKGYPDLATLVIRATPDKVFAASRSTLLDMGLDLVDSDATQGRLEATATSLVFGFKDDVVVRIVAGADATRVDVRSKSRVGRNDFGMNAKRIRTFAEQLRGKLG